MGRTRQPTLHGWHGKNRRIGSGEFLDPSEAVHAARTEFIAVLYQLAPECHRALARPELLELRNAHHLSKRPPTRADCASLPPSPYVAALQAWQQQFHLSDHWCLMVADETIRQRAEFQIPFHRTSIAHPSDYGDDSPWVFQANGEVDGGETLRRWRAQDERRTIHLRDLYMDQGALGIFNPNDETIAAALKRLTDDFASRLQPALERVAASERPALASAPITLPDISKFARLVRWQVLGESHKAIAESVGVTPQAVSNGIKKDAASIGLTRRASGRPGRPKQLRWTRSRIHRFADHVER